MAIFSSHLLNSTDGSHAKNVEVIINQIDKNGKRKIFLKTKTDKGGRILKEFILNKNDCKCDYEFVCKTGKFFSKKNIIYQS